GHTIQSVGVRVLLWLVPCWVYLWHTGSKVVTMRTLWRLPPTRQRFFGALTLVTVASLAVSVDVARKLNTTVPGVWTRLISQGQYEGFQTPFFEELVFRGV